MGLYFCSFSSGSSGNSYLIKSENTAILVDAGISCKRIMEGLKATETEADAVSAVLITHEHSDHTGGLPVLSKHLTGASVYANGGTWGALGACLPDCCRREVFVTGRPFEVGDIRVTPFRNSHDAAEPVGFTFELAGRKLGMLTDTGAVTDEAFEAVKDADLLVLEANYEKEVLISGRYPIFLKERILGQRGHLSNVNAADFISRLLELPEACAEKERTVLLAHMSKENNFPELAYQTVKNCLEERDHYLGDDLHLGLLLRDCRGEIYEV